MTVVPAATPVNTPVTAVIGATDMLLLDHVPPGTALVKVMELPTQTVEDPAIGTGSGLTVTGWVTKLAPTV